MKSTLINLTASTLALGVSMAGFAAIATSAASNAAPESDNRTARDAAGDAAEAREALAENRADRAVRYAERAVEKLPYSAEYRHLLGRAYLAVGRFASAETSFQDALTINPEFERSGFNLALTLIAQGRRQDALEELADLEGRIGASDLGLALALAGNHERAIDVLQQAARANGGDPRARQNLALTYAMAGRWAESRITAAQDINLANLNDRMTQWASFASPTNSWDQVATLLGVEADGRDGGQPQRLALAPMPTETMLAAAPAGAGVPAPIVAFAAPAPIGAPPSAPRVTEVDVPPPVIAAAPAPIRSAPPPAVAVASAPSSEFIVEDEPVYLASAEPTAPRPAPVAAQRPAPAPIAAPRSGPAPIAASRPVASPQSVHAASAPRSRSGNYMVQLGAYSQQANVALAWDRAVRRHAGLAEFTPSRATFERGHTLYRLSFGGFETRNEARGMCRTLKAQGIDCFVRARAGDSPLQIAARAGTGLASLR